MDDNLERVDLDSVLAGVHVCRVRSSMLWPMVDGQVWCLAPALDPSYSIKTKKKGRPLRLHRHGEHGRVPGRVLGRDRGLQTAKTCIYIYQTQVTRG